jgi:TP901 family phage tail tape measure protein
MATLDLVVKLTDNASGGLKSITAELSGMDKTTGTLSRGFSGLQTAMVGSLAAGTVAMGAFVAFGIKGAADLEAQLSGIAATLGTTADQIEPLKDLISDLSLDPNLKVSTTEAATAVEMLARNGLTMTQIMDGAALSVVALANATGSDFALSADVMTDAMAQFNIEAGDLEQVIDGITGVVVNSKFTMEDFAYALAQGGGVAGVAGVEFSDFATSIAAISPLFASGQDAGTSFKTMLMRMAAPTDDAQALMNQLGLSFYDANGNMRDMASIAGQLNSVLYGTSQVTSEVGGRTADQNRLLEEARKSYRSAQQSIERYELGLVGAGMSEEARAKKIADLNAQMVNAGNIVYELEGVKGELITTTKQLTEEERTAALTTLFGSDAMRAAAGIAGYTEEEFRKLAEGVNAQGSAMDSAATRMDNLQGDLEIFMGVVEAAGIKIGEAMIPALRGIVQGMTAVADFAVPLIIGGLDTLTGKFETTSEDVSKSMEDVQFAFDLYNLLIDGGVERSNALEIALGTLDMEGFAPLVESVLKVMDAFGELQFAFDLYNLLIDGGVERAKALELALGTLGIDGFGALIDQALSFVEGFVSVQDVLLALGIVAAVIVIPAIWGILAPILAIIAVGALLVGGIALIRNAWEENWFGIRDIADSVLAQIALFWETYGAQITEIATSVWNAIMNIVTTVGLIIGAAVMVFWELLVYIWESYGERISYLFQFLWETLLGFFGGFATYLEGATGALLAIITGDWEGLKESVIIIVTGMWEMVSNAFLGAVAVLITATGIIISEIQGVWNAVDWGALGRGLLDGIVFAIMGGLGRVVEAAAALAAAALAAVSGGWEVESPSKAFARLAEYAVDGVTMTFDSSLSDIANTSASLAAAMIPAPNAFATTSTPTFSGDALGFGGGVTVNIGTGAIVINGGDGGDMRSMINEAINDLAIQIDARIRA